MIKKSKSLTMSKHRGHKQHEIEDIGNVVSDFSNLPDCILQHILSFMPTNEVVKTSILSTRWKNLWASVPNIDIDEKNLRVRDFDGWCRPNQTSFVNFVERVLRLRGASNMKKFRLSCHTFDDASQLRSWISNAIMHNVQELDLNLYGVAPSVIPWSTFESTSLVSLKLRMPCFIKLPSHFSFPHLKNLHLAYVRFLIGDRTVALFSDCPVLEELVLSNCIWMHSKNIAISSSTLKSLTIHDVSRFEVFKDPTSGCKMKIDATNLSYFEYTGFLSTEILLNNASSLVKACVFVHIPFIFKWRKQVACRAIDLLERLQNVVSLRVSNDTMESLMVANNMRIRFRMFPNFTHLMLTMEIGRNDFGALMDFLYSCPNLRSICLSEGFKHRMCLSEHDPIWLQLPACVSNCLKRVTLKNFHAYDSEVCFIKCVLKYACVLEKMDIWWYETELRGVKWQTKVRTELETIQRISPACVFKFS